MIEIRPASEHDVVLAFLQAEIDSPKYESDYRNAMAQRGLSRALIDAPNLTDAQANNQRISLLAAVRGFGCNAGLFQGFPVDVVWRLVTIEPADFPRLKYIGRDAGWRDITGGTRLVVDGARNLESNARIAGNFHDTRQAIEQGRCTAPLILVEVSDGAMVIVEGHTRATAYALLGDRSFPAFVGTSPLMSRWWWV